MRIDEYQVGTMGSDHVSHLNIGHERAFYAPLGGFGMILGGAGAPVADSATVSATPLALMWNIGRAYVGIVTKFVLADKM